MRQSPPRDVIVLEDDIELSDDALIYFEWARRRMAAGGGTRGRSASAALDPSRGPLLDPGTPHFATAFSLTRPSVLVGHDDAAWWLWGRRRLQQQEQPAEAAAVRRLIGSPRAVFKTLAWLTDRAGYTELRMLLAAMAAYEPSPWRRLVEDTLQAVATKAAALAAGGGFGDGGSQQMQQQHSRIAALARNLVFRSGHPQFQQQAEAPGSSSISSSAASCAWCADYCYDHAIEWVLRGRPFLAPVVPRVTQQRGSGMTSVENDVNERYTGGRVGLRYTEADDGLAESLQHWFRAPGISAMAPPLPPPPQLPPPPPVALQRLLNSTSSREQQDLLRMALAAGGARSTDFTLVWRWASREGTGSSPRQGSSAADVVEAALLRLSAIGGTEAARVYLSEPLVQGMLLVLALAAILAATCCGVCCRCWPRPRRQPADQWKDPTGRVAVGIDGGGSGVATALAPSATLTRRTPTSTRGEAAAGQYI